MFKEGEKIVLKRRRRPVQSVAGSGPARAVPIRTVPAAPQPVQIRVPERPELALAGFKMNLGTVKRLNDKGCLVDSLITLSKDPYCWNLRIGDRVVYPSTMSGVIDTLLKENISLAGVRSMRDLHAEFLRVEELMKAYAKQLDLNIRHYLGVK